jgi:hypothetical protein
MGNAISRMIAGLIVWWERDIMGTLNRFGRRVQQLLEGVENALNFGNFGRDKQGGITVPGAILGIVNPVSSNVTKKDSLDKLTGGFLGRWDAEKKAREKEEKDLQELRNMDASPVGGYVKPSKDIPIIKNSTKNSSNTTNNTINVSAMTQAQPQDIASTILDVLNNNYANARNMSYG